MGIHTFHFLQQGLHEFVQKCRSGLFTRLHFLEEFIDILDLHIKYLLQLPVDLDDGQVFIFEPRMEKGIHHFSKGNIPKRPWQFVRE